MNASTPLWFATSPLVPFQLRGLKIIFVGRISKTRIKVRVADGQPNAGEMFAACWNHVVEVCPHSGKKPQAIAAVREYEAPVEQKAAPVSRPSASLESILGTGFIRS